MLAKDKVTSQSQSFIESYNGLCWKRPLKVIQPKPLCHEQGHLQLDQVAQSPVQPDFECFQGIDHLSGQPVPVLHHPQGKKFLPYI